MKTVTQAKRERKLFILISALIAIATHKISIILLSFGLILFFLGVISYYDDFSSPMNQSESAPYGHDKNGEIIFSP